MLRKTRFQQVPLEVVKKVLKDEIKRTDVQTRREQSGGVKATGKTSSHSPQGLQQLYWKKNMNDTVDIFRVETRGVRWLESAATLECAEVRVKKLALESPGEYIVLDQRTGNKHVIRLEGMQE